MYKDYPQLALDENWTIPADFNATLKEFWKNKDKKTESLNYLFDPDMTLDDGKASYPNVTGLFRINDQGYYYFRSQDVFAELNEDQEYDPTQPKTSTDNNHITLYDIPWQESHARGQFFPFNDWTKLFYQVNGNIGQWGDQGDQIVYDQPMNHWFGMTIETKLMQPAGGKLSNGTSMTFEFSGDDDVWIFIDGVLVADVGGNHSRIRVTIDFSTGNIDYYKNLPSTGLEGTLFATHTLLEMFEAAGQKGITTWSGDTFADGTIHDLKFFYLERGNAASNCNIMFNLQEPIAERIRKVDQNGDPLEGAEFELYEATTTPGSIIGDGEWWHTSEEFETTGISISTTRSDSGGYALLTNAKGESLTFDKDIYYILKETDPPVGYRKNPPIVLKYHDDSKTLKVVNKYEVGAYASFIAEWTSSSKVYSADYLNGSFSQRGGEVAGDDLKKGLVIVVPAVNKGGKWLPMYGSNTLGWNTVTHSGGENDFIKALVEAALRQMADTDPKTQDWYLRWDGARLKGQMENLPGDATRYVFNGGSEGDLITLFLSEDALDRQGLGGYEDVDERYMALSELAGNGEETLTRLVNAISADLSILYTDEDSGFDKNSHTVIYVPNEQRELRVRKVNESGKPIGGAVFALFNSSANAAAGTSTASNGVLAFGTTGRNGELIFRANALTDSESDYGYAKMDWDSDRTVDTAVYWLKEIKAPSGYELNKNLIRIEVGNAGIYANATGFDSAGTLLEGDAADNDGIIVEASLGRLTQTLVKYAEGIVDATLTDITVTKQFADSEDGALDIDSWDDADGDEAESEERTYDNGYDPVVFKAENNYVRVMPRQTKGITSDAHRDILTDNGTEAGEPIGLDGLFSLINTVVVTDTPRSGTVSDPTVDVPDDPAEPNTPAEPVAPSGPDDPGEADKSDVASKPENPKTDDETRLGLWSVAITLSLIAAVRPLRKRSKRQK